MLRLRSSLFPHIAVSAAWVALTAFCGYMVPRSDFPLLLGSVAAMWMLYLYVLGSSRWSGEYQRWYLGLGILLRVVLLFSIPNLSDDFYRFIWDGRLAAHSIHPFAHPPVYFIENHIEIPGITPESYRQLNSPEYFTVYPPVCQAVFWSAAKLFPAGTAGPVFIIKLFLLACEIGTIGLLLRLAPVFNSTRQVPPALWYALNPLAVLEITGNCHFEGAMLFFLLAGLWAVSKRRYTGGAVSWAFATASKLLPLMFLPALIRWLGLRQGARFLSVFMITFSLVFVPLFDMEIVRHIGSSLKLYFRQFEFNAGLYYVLKWIWQAFAPPKLDVARTLGPILGITVLAGIAAIAIFRKRATAPAEKPAGVVALAENLVLSLALYLALATTIHPWYIVPLFGLSLLTPWRFPLVWSGVVVLSYSHYRGGGFQEQPVWIALEYLSVYSFFIIDMWKRPHSLVLSPTK